MFGISTSLGLVALGNSLPCGILIYNYKSSRLVAELKGHIKEFSWHPFVLLEKEKKLLSGS